MDNHSYLTFQQRNRINSYLENKRKSNYSFTQSRNSTQASVLLLARTLLFILTCTVAIGNRAGRESPFQLPNEGVNFLLAGDEDEDSSCWESPVDLANLANEKTKL